MMKHASVPQIEQQTSLANYNMMNREWQKNHSNTRTATGYTAYIADACQVAALAGLLWLLLAWSGDLLASEATNIAQPMPAAQLTQEQQAAQLQAQENHRLSNEEVSSGQLRYFSKNGDVKVDMPLDTQVSMQVSGWLNRVSVRQTFRNNSPDWLSGKYLFPLPTNAAVDTLRMHIGDRIIEGVIQTKKEAKKTFEAAKTAGKRASLVEQQRPNMFTSSVANLAPNETLVVEIVYQELVEYDKGEFSLRFPMTITPRYIPKNSLNAQEAASIATPVKSADLDAFARLQNMFGSGTSSPFLTMNTEEEGNINVSLRVELDAGLGLAMLESAYHQIDKTMTADGRYQVQLKPGYKADHDFVLQWQVQPGLEPKAVMFSQFGRSHQSTNPVNSVDNRSEQELSASGDNVSPKMSNAHLSEKYSLLMLMPPLAKAESSAGLPRELVLVIDTSGSMSGGAIMQAKAALLEALKSLQPHDSFNVIAFSNKVKQFSSHSLVANKQNLGAAKQFVSRLYSDGGTELGLALSAAFANQTGLDHDRTNTDLASATQSKLRQVIFITDGAVGNEQQLFELITNQLAESRLFTVGIGSAPNSHFMERAAEVGRGSFTYIGKIGEVEQKIQALLTKISSPVLTDIKVEYADGTIPDYWPNHISDLYYGEPMLVAIKSRADNLDTLRVSGNIAGQYWQQQLSAEMAAPQTRRLIQPTTELSTSAAEPRDGVLNAKGLDLIWARKYISALALAETPMNEQKTKQQIIGLALKYHLVSAHTSLVAVDNTPVRSAQEPMKEGQVRQHLPQHNLAAMPQTASGSLWLINMGALMIALSLMFSGVLWMKQRGILINAGKGRTSIAEASW